MINEYSALKRLETIFSCTVRAVNTGFKHLPVRFIINPPHRLFDAMLARQIVIHIVHHVFAIPRRRIVASLGRTRSAVSTSITTVNIRLNEPCFAREYDKWADKAQSLFQRETNKLAEAA